MGWWGVGFAGGYSRSGFVLAHAVGLGPSLRGGGPDRTGRLFAALIRRGLCVGGVDVCAHAVGLGPSLRGGGPDRTGRLFAALIRMVRSMESRRMACSRARALSVETAKSCPALMRRPRGAATSVACVSASGKAANKNSSPSFPRPPSSASGYCSCHKLKSRMSQGSERMLPGTRSDSENMMPESTQFSSWSAAFPPRPCGTTRSAKRKRRPAVIPNFAFRQTEAGLKPLG